MNILFTVLEIISDNVFLIAAVLFTNLFINTTDCLLSKRRLVVSLAVSAVSGILFRSNYISNHLLVINGILVVVNFLKFVILISYVHKIINRKLILITLILQFVCSVITSTVLLIIPFEDTYNYHLLITVCNLIVNFILLILIIPMQKRMDRYSFSTVIKIIPTYIYILILCAFFFLSGIVNITHHDTSNINIKITIIKFLAPLLTVCLLIIILSLIVNVISEKYKSDINSMLKKQISSQLYHYKQFEEINTEIRSFKHDYINHMKCMSSMLSNKEYTELKEYIDNLSSALPTVKYLFETGNYIADAILTEKQRSAPSDITIEFEGVVPTFIDNTDLCTMLSNAIDNAVEACCLCSGNKTIKVCSGFKHGYFILKIKNPTVNDIEKSNLATTKSDTVNHGFGLFNIRRTVQKYDGHVSTYCEDHIFTLNIALYEKQ